MEGYNSDDVDNVTFNGTDGSSMSASLLESTHAPAFPITENGEGMTNGINPNTQTIIPENQGEVGDAEVDRRALSDQHIIERALFFHAREHFRGGSRERSPLLNINLHKYEEKNSTCPEMKDRCSICLEEFSDKEELARIDCGHIYHINCLKEWNMIENNCPICKRKVAVICHYSRLTATIQLNSSSVN